MLNSRRKLCGWLLYFTLWLFSDGAGPAVVFAADEAPAANAPVTEKKLTFEEDIVPILEARCLKCHGEQVRKASLDLRRRFSMLKGGDSGAAIVPGKPDESLMVELIAEGNMPPKEEGRLDEKQAELLKRWIAMGAPTAAKEEPPLEIADAGDGALTDADRQFWSFQPPRPTAVPSGMPLDRIRTPIDAFLLAKLAEQGLTFNPDAPKLVLLRRLCFDLLGLPPTGEQIQEFLADERGDAYERLVDRLLESPRYGERWGRHWLDVAGYADTDGYLEADRDRPEAWRYRDYVIQAFNEDKPYNRFILEQMAGDELADWRQLSELTPEVQTNLIATGFLRTAADPTYPGYKEKPECYKVMADTTQIVSSAFFGLTVQCARCHSHKSDPISQRDYYQLHAIFLPAYDPDRWLVSIERTIPLGTESQIAKTNQYNQVLDQRLAALNGELAEITQRYRDKFLNEQVAGVEAALREPVKVALLAEPAKRTEEQKKLVADHAAKVSLAEADIVARFPELKTEGDAVRAAIAAETALRKKIVPLRGILDVYAEQPAVAHVLRRGDFNNLGQEVVADLPKVLAQNVKYEAKPGYKTTGRRLAFAQWLVNAEQNPLTARVQMNRMWAHHYGRGIVATLDDFGHSGEAPTHPELLDWLAREFIARGWSQKAMHRLMLNSTAYRQTSAQDAAQVAADPDNRLWGRWQPLRHEGEVVRDSLLALSGKLSLQMFGVPVPVVRQADGQVVTNDDPQGNRRSIYLIVRRSQPVTLLELFDTPRMEVNCTRRTEAIVSPQALTMLNSKFVDGNATGFSQQILKIAGGDQNGRIDQAYRTAFCREATPTERQAIGEFLEAVVKDQLGEKTATATPAERQAAVDAGWPQVCQILLNSNEFLYVH